MGTRKMWLMGVICALGLGCGSDSAEGEDTSGGEELEAHNTQHEGDEHEYADLPEMAPALEQFHYAFSDHWHDDRSAGAVCPDMEGLQALAVAAADEHAEPSQANELRTTTQAVADACADSSHTGYDSAFDRMHHALHTMMGTPLGDE